MADGCMFTVLFHSRFRVGAAYGIDGIDLAVPRSDPLPADHIKGVMRASAGQLAATGFVDPKLVDEVFGTIRTPSPWTWFGASPDKGEYAVTCRNRVRIDPVTQAGVKDMLVTGEQAWTAKATFEIRQIDPVANVAQHRALLRLAARHTQHLGAWRRRGLGWVTMDPGPDSPSASDDLDLLTAAPIGQRA